MKLVELDKAYVEKIEALKQNYIEKMKKTKAEWDQQNQIKLKSWKERKTRELKDMTVKGLEPELNRLMKKYEDEKNNMKAYYENLLKENEVSFNERVNARIQEERDKLVAENDKVLKNDRDTLEKKTLMEKEFYENNMKREIEAVKKLCEKEKITIENIKNKEIEDLKQRTKRLGDNFEKEKADFENKRKIAEETYKINLKNEFEIEKKNLVEKYEKTINDMKSKQEKELERYKNELTHKLEAEKNEEIEMVINKLSEELVNKKCDVCAKNKGRNAEKEELEREYNSKIRELRKEIDYLTNKNQVLELKAKDLQALNNQINEENGKKLTNYEKLAIENEQLKAQNRYLDNERKII